MTILEQNPNFTDPVPATAVADEQMVFPAYVNAKTVAWLGKYGLASGETCQIGTTTEDQFEELFQNNPGQAGSVLDALRDAVGKRHSLRVTALGGGTIGLFAVPFERDHY